MQFGLKTLPKSALRLSQYSWGQAPQGLMTKNQLKAKGLMPVGPACAAIWYNKHNKFLWLWDYNDEKAVVERPLPSPTRIAAIQKRQLKRWICLSCGQIADYNLDGTRCEECRKKIKCEENRKEATRAMNSIFASGENCVILDIATTGYWLPANLVDIAVLGLDGSILFNQRLKTPRPSTHAIH